MSVVDVLCDEAFEEAASLPGGKDLVGHVRRCLAEVVVEDLPNHRPGLVGVRKEVVQLQHSLFSVIDSSGGRLRKNKSHPDLSGRLCLRQPLPACAPATMKQPLIRMTALP